MTYRLATVRVYAVGVWYATTDTLRHDTGTIETRRPVTFAAKAAPPGGVPAPPGCVSWSHHND